MRSSMNRGCALLGWPGSRVAWLVILMGRRRWGIPVGLSETSIDEAGDCREASYHLSTLRVIRGRECWI